MNELKIEKYRIVDDGSKKPFCVYLVEANVNDSKFIVERRYSQFHALHGELRKLYPTPYFPPKKVRSLQQRVLEKRRQALEKYLQEMLKFNQSRSQVLSFLGINKSETEYDSEKVNEVKSGHQPLFQFKKDFIPHGSRKSNLPDIIEDGGCLCDRNMNSKRLISCEVSQSSYTKKNILIIVTNNTDISIKSEGIFEKFVKK